GHPGRGQAHGRSQGRGHRQPDGRLRARRRVGPVGHRHHPGVDDGADQVAGQGAGPLRHPGQLRLDRAGADRPLRRARPTVGRRRPRRGADAEDPGPVPLAPPGAPVRRLAAGAAAGLTAVGLDHRPGDLGQRRLRDAMNGDPQGGDGVLGSAVPRKEDVRLLTGRGRYVSDMVLPGMLHAAFVRSPYAHADVTGVDGSAARATPGVATVVAGDDPMVIGVRITARSELPGYVETSQPLLAWPKVRFAGEAVAVVVAADRATAADAAELVEVGYEPRPVVVDPLVAFDSGGGGGNGAGAVVHHAAPDNVFLRRRFEAGDPDGALAASHLVVERTYRTNRQAGTPLEARAVLASWDAADRTLTLWSGTQIPHLARHALAVLLGMAERRIRVVAPDVGGGFGVKASLYPEEVVVCQLALKVGRPGKSVEARTEHMVTPPPPRPPGGRLPCCCTRCRG